MCIYKNPCEYCNFAQCDKMPIDGIRDLSSKLLLYSTELGSLVGCVVS